MPSWPEADWKPVHPFPFDAARRSFTAHDDSGRIRIDYFRRGSDARLVAVASFGPLSEGAPGQVHGGGILTVLDEALGAAAWLEGHAVLTVRLNAEFRKTVPVGAALLVETLIARVRHRLVWVEGTLTGADGTRYASASGEFLKLDPGRQRDLLGRSAS